MTIPDNSVFGGTPGSSSAVPDPHVLLTTLAAIGGAALVGFSQIGVGAVLGTVQSQLQKTTFLSDWTTGGQYTAARNALAGTMAVPNLYVNGTLTALTSIIAPSVDSGSVAALQFSTNNGAVQAKFGLAASAAVNYWDIRGSAGGADLAIFIQGVTADVGYQFTTKGLGSTSFWSDGSGSPKRQFRIRGDLASVNFFDVFGDIASGTPQIRAEGSDLNISAGFYSKGTGSILLASGQGARIIHRFNNVPNSVNYLTSYPSATGTAVNFAAEGTDSNIQFNIKSKGGGNMVLGTGGAAAVQMYTNLDGTAVLIANFNYIASGVNRWDFYPSATATDLIAQAEGTDTNVGVQIRSKGTGSLTFATGQGARVGFKIIDIASSTIFIQLNPGAAGGRAGFFALGDPAAGLQIAANGAGDVLLSTGAGTRIGFQVVDTASSVNWLVSRPAATGNRAQLEPAGEANAGLSVTSKGTGDVVISTAGAAHAGIQVIDVASAVNWLLARPGATTVGASLEAAGETNVNLIVKSKGTGTLKLDPTTGDIQWGKALVALGGGAAPTLGTIGGTGPATAAQNTWMRVLDSAGAAFWVPVWK